MRRCASSAVRSTSCAGRDAPRAPAPRLADLDRLVATVGASGLDVAPRRPRAPPTQLPAAVELAAYRIVQEALTNVSRHAARDVGDGPPALRRRASRSRWSTTASAAPRRPGNGIAGHARAGRRARRRPRGRTARRAAGSASSPTCRSGAARRDHRGARRRPGPGAGRVPRPARRPGRHHGGRRGGGRRRGGAPGVERAPGRRADGHPHARHRRAGGHAADRRRRAPRRRRRSSS